MATETVYTTGKSSTNARINIGSGAIATADGQIAFPDECSSIKLAGVSSHADGTGVLLSVDNNGIIKKTAGTNITVAMIDQIAASAAVSATPTTLGTVYGQTMTDGNVILGSNAAAGLVSDATSEDNTAIGRESLFSVSAGTNANTAIGTFALYDLTTGNGNTAVGRNSATALTTGSNNTFVGQGTLTSVVGCTNSTALGVGANITASNQLALAFAIDHIKADGLGTAADADGTLLAIDSSGIIRKTAGTSNTVALIEAAIASAVPSAATSTTLGTTYGKINTDTSVITELSMAVGYQIPDILTSGTNQGNTLIGYKATGAGVTTSGYGNTVLGCVSMYNFVSGNRNTAIGHGSGVTLTTGSNNTYIGAAADMDNGSYSNSIALGADCFAKASNEFAVAPLVTQWRSEGLSNIAPKGYSKLIFDATNKIIRPQAGGDVWCASLGSDYSQAVGASGSNALISGLVASFGSTSSWLTSGTTITIPSGFPTNGLWEVTAFAYTTNSSTVTSVALNVLRNDIIAASFEGANSTTNYVGRGGSRVLQLSPGHTIKMRLGWGSTGVSSFLVKTDGTYIHLKFLGLGTL
jgi:hypothetical protein